MNNTELRGKIFQLLNLDNSVMEEFIITHVRVEKEESKTHEDGSVSPLTHYTLVSDNGSGWHRLCGSSFKIIDPITHQELNINL